MRGSDHDAGKQRGHPPRFDSYSHDQLELLARRIRRIGPQRILYGSDAAFGGRNTPDRKWGTFRGMVPLSDADHAVIRDNVAPYLR